MHTVSRDQKRLAPDQGRTIRSEAVIEVYYCALLGGGALIEAPGTLRNFILLGQGESPLLAWRIGTHGRSPMENGLSGDLHVTRGVAVRSCTITGRATFKRSLHPSNAISITGCIVRQVEAGGGTRGCLGYNDIYGRPPVLGGIALSGCLTADPQFRDPANLDYRLKPTSPCRGKASDGGDLGCRWTPEMVELLKKVQELRKKGIIKF